MKTNTLKFHLSNINKFFGPDKAAFKEELNRISDDIEQFEYLDVELLKSKSVSTSESQDVSGGVNFNSKISAGVDKGVGCDVTAGINRSSSEKLGVNQEFSEALLKSFNPILIMRSIKGLLERIGIKSVFFCLDDFSEIDLDAMKAFVDVIVAPLNNLSDEFFRFKIAAYPGRIYLGDIDPQKVEQIRLDFYELYQARAVSVVHNQAQDSIPLCQHSCHCT